MFYFSSLDSKIEEAKLHKNKRLAAREEIINLAKARDAERDEHKAVEHALQYGLVPKAIDQVGAEPAVAMPACFLRAPN